MKRALFLVASLLCAGPAFAQATYPTPAGSRVNGVVPLICDSTGANCAPAGTAAAGAEKVQGDTAAGTANTGNPVQTGGVYVAADPSYANGQRTSFRTSSIGDQRVVSVAGSPVGDGIGASMLSYTITAASNLAFPAVGSMVFDGSQFQRQRGDATGTYVVEVPSAVAAAGVSTNATTTASSALVAKASAGNLYGYNVVSGASAGYLLIFNATAAPADGTVTPARCIPLAANTGIEADLRGQPTYFSAGITLVFSTTGCFTKTASATAFIAADVK